MSAARSTPSFNWRTLTLAAGTVTASTLASASICAEQAVNWQAAQVSAQSDWQELDPLGRQLVRESGTLAGSELSAGLNCGNWHLEASLTQLEGDRAYEGLTSSGVAARSSSAVRQVRGHLQAGYRVNDAWRVGLRWSGQTSWRDIASSSGAAGYPEQFDWTLLSAGTQWKTALGPGQLTLAAWTGTPLSAGMLLTLPGRDPASLPLGAISQSELTIGWRLPLGTAWSLQVDATVRRTDIEAGTDVVIRRNGVPVAVAHQPQTSVLERPLTIRVDYTF